MYSKTYILLLYRINDNEVHCIYCILYNIHRIKYNKNILWVSTTEICKFQNINLKYEPSFYGCYSGKQRKCNTLVTFQ